MVFNVSLCLILLVLGVVRNVDSVNDEEAGSQLILGRCYSRKDCSSYSAAGGKWTKGDCCAIDNRCWCDQNGWCQPTCSYSDNREHTVSQTILGKCYSSNDCTSYTAAGGKWTRDDCCAIGSRCWCDRSGRCSPTCQDSQVKESAQIILGKCYSSKDCTSYTAAGGYWTKSDCCAIGSRCWCDRSGRCSPTCQESQVKESAQIILGKCYSSKDCTSYTAAGGYWTKSDCCAIGSRCWCDRSGRCSPTCQDSQVKESVQIILGKCYSSKDCTSYTAAGGYWTKSDCCVIGNLCWCDQSGRCQSTCVDSNDENSEIQTVLGKCYSSADCEYSSQVAGSWTKKDCCMIGHHCWCDQNEICEHSCSFSSQTGENYRSTLEPTSNPNTASTTGQTVASDSDLNTYVPTSISTSNPNTASNTGQTVASDSDLTDTYVPTSISNPVGYTGHVTSDSDPITGQFSSESDQSTAAHRPVGNHTHSRNMLYLLFLILTVFFPLILCLLCVWYVKKLRITTIINLNYVEVNTNVA